jgi:Flp pilus assembly protein TadD
MAAGQDAPASSTPGQTQSTAGETSSSKTHQERGTKNTVRHTRVVDEAAQPAELGQAEDLIQKQNYAGAEPLLHKAVEADPTNYVAWFDLGFTENALGKVDQSIAAYRKSVAAKPDVFESNLNLGLQLSKTGQPDAEQFLRAATHLKPTSHVSEGLFRAWLSLAHLLETAKPDDALAAYRQAAALQPKDAEPHVAAGQMLEKQEKFADAEGEYKQALAVDPSSDAIVGLADMYVRGHKFAEAEQYLRQIAKQHPEQAAAHVQLGRVLAAEGKNEDAIAELQSAAKLAPGDTSVQADLAELYSNSGKQDLAESAYRALLTAHPDDATLHHKLGDTLLREKKFPEAQQEFLVAVKLKPNYGEAYGDLAFAASENKEYPLTIKALEARAKFLPEAPITYFLRGSAYDHLKDYKQAAVNFHLFLNTANGKYPDQEWQAKHRLIAIEPKK